MSERKSVFDGALPAAAYHNNILRARVKQDVVRGNSRSLPPPYSARNGTQERDVLRACRQVLKEAGIWHRRLDGTGKVISSGNGEARMIPGEMAGLPDLLCCHDGLLMAIEVKAPGGRLSPAQYATLRGIFVAGGIAMVCCSAERLSTWLKTRQTTCTVDEWLDVL